MSNPAKVLVVANRTADSDELHAALVGRAQDGPVDLTLLAPAAWEVVDPHGGRQSAWRRLNAALTRLAAAGITARGVVGDPDPMAAVRAVWETERFDEVIVATLPRHLSRWLGLDLPGRVERLTGIPTRHVVATEQPVPRNASSARPTFLSSRAPRSTPTATASDARTDRSAPRPKRPRETGGRP